MKKINKRRRREYKTDYKARKNMLKAGLPRIIFRKTNKYITGQLIESNDAQDKVLSTFNSKQLLKKGWPEKLKGSLKSLPAAYLTGYILGKQINLKSEVIFDIGLRRSIAKSRIYAFAKGLKEAGIKIAVKEEVLPEVKADKIDIEKIKSEIGGKFK